MPPFAEEVRCDALVTVPVVTRRVRALIALGSNVGESARTLAAAVHAMAALPDADLVAISSLYRTRPVGLLDQPDFLNAAVALDVPVGPDPEIGALALLLALKRLEAAFGRQRRRRWGPRELDLDLITFGDHRIRVARPPALRGRAASDRAEWLEVPHPEARHRLFVLAPLAELAPNLIPPGWDVTVQEARSERARAEGPGAVEAVAGWDPAEGRWETLA